MVKKNGEIWPKKTKKYGPKKFIFSMNYALHL